MKHELKTRRMLLLPRGRVPFYKDRSSGILFTDSTAGLRKLLRSASDDLLFIDSNTNLKILPRSDDLIFIDTSEGSYRRTIFLTNPENVVLTNTQCEILLNSGNFNFELANPNGDDVRITTSDEVTLCDYVIRSWDSVTKVASLLVKVPSMQASGDTTLYIYYGDPVATAVSNFDDTCTKIAVDAGTVALWHFDEGTGTSLLDETEDYTATVPNNWSESDGGTFGDLSVSFADGDAITLNGTDQKITVPGLLDTFPESGTIMMWVRTNDDVSVGQSILLTKINSETPNHQNILDLRFLNNKLFLYVIKDSSAGDALVATTVVPTPFTIGSWYHLVLEWDTSGWSVWINGFRTYKGLVPGVPETGTTRPFCIGATNYGGNYVEFAPVTIDEFCVMDRCATYSEIIRHYNRMKFTVGQKSQYDRWIPYAGNPILWPTIEHETYGVNDPSVVCDNGVWKLWYMGGFYAPDDVIAIFYAHSADGKTNWTKEGIVLGHGEGGEDCDIVARTSIVDDGDTRYLFYVPWDDYSLHYATSTDGGESFTAQGVVIAAGAQSWFIAVHNTRFAKLGNTWYMMFEANTGQLYRVGLATASNLAGPWTLCSSNPLSTLESVEGGSASAANLHRSGNQWVTVYHATSGTGLNPSYGYWAVSGDGITWQKPIDRVVALLDYGAIVPGHDQVADFFVIEVSGASRLYFDADKNSPTYSSKFCVLDYAGTLDSVFALPIIGEG